jgi:hypothetical protein
MNSLRCSNCSFLNFATASACKRCGFSFEPAAETEWNPQPYAPQPDPYAQPTGANSYYWDQPSYQSSYVPPPAPSGSSGKTIAGIFAVLAVLGLVAFIAIPKLLKAKKTDFTNLSWTEYRAPDGTFTVSLPVAPKEKQMTQTTQAGYIQVNIVEAEVGPDGGCLVMYADYPILGKVSVDTLYDQMLQAMASADHLAIGARRYITQDGHQGIEAEFKPPTLKQYQASAIARLFWVSPRLYMVMSGGPETVEFSAVSKRCLDSFNFSQ